MYKGFSEFIRTEHPDPDSLIVNEYIFTELCKLAENYSKKQLLIQHELLKDLLEEVRKYSYAIPMKENKYLELIDKIKSLNFPVVSKRFDPKYTPPFRVGRKQGKAVLDANGIEVVFFSNSEEQARLYCDYLNGY